MSENPVNRVFQMREALAVERCHVVPHHGSYPVGQHVANMLMMLDVLWPEGDPPYRLVQWILRHDVHERWLGDMPAQVRQSAPELKQEYHDAADEFDANLFPGMPVLSEEEDQWLHSLDQLEFYLWSLDQSALGNRHVVHCVLHMQRYFEDEQRVKDTPQQVLEFIRQLFVQGGWRRTEEIGGRYGWPIP